MLNLSDINVQRYQANGRCRSIAVFTHIPTGIFVQGEDNNKHLTRLREKLLVDLEEKVTQAKELTH